MIASCGQDVIVGQLADIDVLGLAADEIEDAVRQQAVVQNDIGALHQAQSAEGKEVRVAWPGADEIDFAKLLASFAIGGTRKSALEFNPRLRLMAGKKAVGHRPSRTRSQKRRRAD